MFQYLESMSEMIRKGIEEANKDLKVEQEHKLVQEVNIVPEIIMCILFGGCVGVCVGGGGGWIIILINSCNGHGWEWFSFDNVKDVPVEDSNP